MTASRRDHLIDTALELFRRHGYQATGIEKILATAGVSKPTLYRHFDSKDELILAALAKWDVESRAWLQGEMEKGGSLPRQHILALFDALERWFDTVGFQGCLFINATVEFAERDNPVHRLAAEHKRSFAAYVRDLVAAAGARDPGEVTAQLMILMDGAIVTAHTQGRSGAALLAKAIAASILDAALAEARHPETAEGR